MKGKRMLQLYRLVLKAHKHRLDPTMRKLGDDYVRAEFKRHRKADTKFLVPFYAEWEKYVIQLVEQEEVGVHMDSNQFSALSAEQTQQLQKLRESITDYHNSDEK